MEVGAGGSARCATAPEADAFIDCCTTAIESNGGEVLKLIGKQRLLAMAMAFKPLAKAQWWMNRDVNPPRSSVQCPNECYTLEGLTV